MQQECGGGAGIVHQVNNSLSRRVAAMLLPQNMTNVWPVRGLMMALRRTVSTGLLVAMVAGAGFLSQRASSAPTIHPVERDLDVTSMAGQAISPALFSDRANEFLHAVQISVREGFERAPALVLGLGLLAAVPPLALAGWFLRRRLAAREAYTEDAAPEPTYLMPRSEDGGMGSDVQPVLTEGGPAWPTAGWIEGPGGQRFGLGRSIMRIGRDPDNDICLSDKTVHRYHAAIHRSEDGEYVITDLSSADGNGIAINGNRMPQVRLRDGDVIELGNVSLRFIARPC